VEHPDALSRRLGTDDASGARAHASPRSPTTGPAWTDCGHSPSRLLSFTTSAQAGCLAVFSGWTSFFVLSGYLITLAVGEPVEPNPQARYRPVLPAAGRRLFPALYAMIATIVLATAVLAPSELHRLRGDVLAALNYVTNWAQILWNRSYFQAFQRPSLLQHLWSLAIEEQFYLIWPLILLVTLSAATTLGSPRSRIAGTLRLDHHDVGRLQP